MAASKGVLSIIDLIDADEIDEDELLAFVGENSRNGISFDNSKKTVGYGHYKSQMFQLMRYRGWVDTCEGPYATFRRGDTV